MAAIIKKPFTVKGFKITSPKGTALWCKIETPDREFNPKGMYSVDLVCAPEGQGVPEFVEKLETLRDTALEQANKGKPKPKQYKAREVYKEEYDAEGEPTGNIIFKFKMNNVDDRKPGQNKVRLVGPKASKGEIPMVTIGNGSTIRCAGFANPYAMASDKTIGVSLILEKVQLINLIEYGGGDEFEDEEGDLPEDLTQSEAFDDEEENYEQDDDNGDF